MKQHYNHSLFIFRRDLRIHDNNALREALTQSGKVITCFIFDPRQIGNTNRYRSLNALQFMLTSLKDLEKSLKDNKGRLYYFIGQPEEIIKKINSKINLDAVFINLDYTPFSRTRDKDIAEFCNKNNIILHTAHDSLLNEPEKITKADGNFYSMFTPFHKKAIQQEVTIPHTNHATNYFVKDLIGEAHSADILKQKNNKIFVHGGRKEALNLLKEIEEQKNYLTTHDFPSKNTSKLSAHNKFGTVSIREVWHTIARALGKQHPLLRQLYWRDFFTQIAFHRPDVFGSAFHKEYNLLRWNSDTKDFERWCTGTTGFPIVDAGMRQLTTTGFMHNRVRMIVASFLVKDLHIDWRKGEQYFAQHLVDYDPAVNNGNWQWAASTGCDAQPYFRIFNPWLQQKKFDPEALYIKQWIPELQKFSAAVIHNWYKQKAISTYPQPMLDHKAEAAQAIALFRKAKSHK